MRREGVSVIIFLDGKERASLELKQGGRDRHYALRGEVKSTIIACEGRENAIIA